MRLTRPLRRLGTAAALHRRAAGGVWIPASVIFDGLADASAVTRARHCRSSDGRDTASGIHLCAARTRQYGGLHVGNERSPPTGTDLVRPCGRHACEQRS